MLTQKGDEKNTFLEGGGGSWACLWETRRSWKGTRRSPPHNRDHVKRCTQTRTPPSRETLSDKRNPRSPSPRRHTGMWTPKNPKTGNRRAKKPPERHTSWVQRRPPRDPRAGPGAAPRAPPPPRIPRAPNVRA